MSDTTFHEGDRVVYVPYPGGPREHGTVKSVYEDGSNAFVRYDGAIYGKLTPCSMLEEAYPCGHEERTRGCGGCDPGATEIVLVDGGPTYWVVVTRYGGYKHFSVKPTRFDLQIPAGARHFTLCRGTSSWTIAEWERVPDHPTLTIEQMHRLPACPDCAEITDLGPRSS